MALIVRMHPTTGRYMWWDDVRNKWSGFAPAPRPAPQATPQPQPAAVAPQPQAAPEPQAPVVEPPPARPEPVAPTFAQRVQAGAHTAKVYGTRALVGIAVAALFIGGLWLLLPGTSGGSKQAAAPLPPAASPVEKAAFETFTKRVGDVFEEVKKSGERVENRLKDLGSRLSKLEEKVDELPAPTPPPAAEVPPAEVREQGTPEQSAPVGEASAQKPQATSRIDWKDTQNPAIVRVRDLYVNCPTLPLNLRQVQTLTDLRDISSMTDPEYQKVLANCMSKTPKGMAKRPWPPQMEPHCVGGKFDPELSRCVYPPRQVARP